MWKPELSLSLFSVNINMVTFSDMEVWKRDNHLNQVQCGDANSDFEFTKEKKRITRPILQLILVEACFYDSPGLSYFQDQGDGCFRFCQSRGEIEFQHLLIYQSSKRRTVIRYSQPNTMKLILDMHMHIAAQKKKKHSTRSLLPCKTRANAWNPIMVWKCCAKFSHGLKIALNSLVVYYIKLILPVFRNKLLCYLISLFPVMSFVV